MFKNKYLKYKSKYLNLKTKVQQGASSAVEIKEEDTLNEQQKEFIKYLQENSPEDFDNFEQAKAKYNIKKIEDERAIREIYRYPPELRKLNYNLWIERYGENHTLWFRKLKEDVIKSNNNFNHKNKDILKEIDKKYKMAYRIIREDIEKLKDVQDFVLKNEFQKFCTHGEKVKKSSGESFCKLCGKKLIDTQKLIDTHKLTKREIVLARINESDSYSDSDSDSEEIINHEETGLIYASDVIFNLARKILEYETKKSLFNYERAENLTLKQLALNKVLEDNSLFKDLSDENLKVFRDDPNKFFLAQK